MRAHAIRIRSLFRQAGVHVTRHIGADRNNFLEFSGRADLALNPESGFVGRIVLPREIDAVVNHQGRAQLAGRGRRARQRGAAHHRRIRRGAAGVVSAQPIKIFRVSRQAGVGKTHRVRADLRNFHKRIRQVGGGTFDLKSRFIVRVIFPRQIDALVAHRRRRHIARRRRRVGKCFRSRLIGIIRMPAAIGSAHAIRILGVGGKAAI